MEAADRKYLLLALGAAVMWGAVGLFTVRLNGRGLNVCEIVTLRTAVCAAGMAAVVLLTDRSGFRLRMGDLAFFILAGTAKILCVLTMQAAQIDIPLSMASVLQMTQPYYVMVAAAVLFGERITKVKVVQTCIAFIGCLVVTDMISGTDTYSIPGIVLALISGIFEAVNIVGTKRSLRMGYSPGAYVLYSNVFALMFGAVLVCFLGDFGNIAGAVSSGVPAAADVLMLGIGCTLVPLMFQAVALKRLDAAVVSTACMTEIVFAAVFGLVLGQDVTPLNVVGMALMMGSLAIMERKERASGGPPAAGPPQAG